MGSYFPDESLFVFDAIPPRQYVGAKAYRKDLEDFFASFPGPVETFEIADLNVVTNGNLGFSHSIQLSVSVDSALGLVAAIPMGRRIELTSKRSSACLARSTTMSIWRCTGEETTTVPTLIGMFPKQRELGRHGRKNSRKLPSSYCVCSHRFVNAATPSENPTGSMIM